MPWSGVITNYSTSPFPEEIYERTREMLIEYEVVITRWPQYTLVLENVSFMHLYYFYQRLHAPKHALLLTHVYVKIDLTFFLLMLNIQGDCKC